MIRKIDDLGRVVLPIEIRRKLGWETGTPIEIKEVRESIVLGKAAAACMVCGSQEKLIVDDKEKYICENCLDRFNKTGQKEEDAAAKLYNIN